VRRPRHDRRHNPRRRNDGRDPDRLLPTRPAELGSTDRHRGDHRSRRRSRSFPATHLNPNPNPTSGGSEGSNGFTRFTRFWFWFWFKVRSATRAVTGRSWHVDERMTRTVNQNRTRTW